MKDLCSQLSLRYSNEVQGLTDHGLFSKKLDELLGRRKAARSPDAPPSPAQLTHLRALKVTPEQLARARNVREASALIDSLKSLKANAPPPPPSDAQVTLLRDLGFTAPAPSTMTETSSLIQVLKKRSKLQAMLRKAEAKGLPAEKKRRIAEYLMGLQSMCS